MSQELISRSSDLRRLQDEGYEVSIVSGHLLVSHVPYVSPGKEVKFGTLVSALTLAGERTARPNTHVVYYIGEQPCDKDGQEILQIKHQVGDKKLVEGLTVNRSFSNKPAGGYPDYYDKMSTYARIISAPAESIDPEVTAKTFIVSNTNHDSVFRYTDTATSRAEIGTLTELLEGYKIAIVGLGGTGSYVLDLIAKTPVAEIHLFDGDRFHQHSAFRSPGAPSLEELRRSPYKVEHFGAIYSAMHQCIKAHPFFIDNQNSEALSGVDFVFLCVDRPEARESVIQAMHLYDKPFIDVGMGVMWAEESLIGILRVSVSTPEQRAGERRVPLVKAEAGDDYSRNIQIADLNCLNAALAVIRWKKLCGFYQDLEGEHFSAYTLNVNQLLSAEY